MKVFILKVCLFHVHTQRTLLFGTVIHTMDTFEEVNLELTAEFSKSHYEVMLQTNDIPPNTVAMQPYDDLSLPRTCTFSKCTCYSQMRCKTTQQPQSTVYINSTQNTLLGLKHQTPAISGLTKNLKQLLMVVCLIFLVSCVHPISAEETDSSVSSQSRSPQPQDNQAASSTTEVPVSRKRLQLVDCHAQFEKDIQVS